MTVHPPPAARRLAAVGLAAAASLMAGCGSSHSGSGTDPARLVPAAAPVYLGAVVRPNGDLRTHAQVTGQALTRQAQPYARLLGALQTPGSPPLDFKRDLEPWLGPNGAVFLSPPASARAQAQTGPEIERLLLLVQQGLLGGSTQAPAFPFSGTGVQGAILLDATDTGKARSFLSTQGARAGAHPTSYRGVALQSTAGGLAFGLVDDVVAIGSEAALHAVIDTGAGAPALAAAPAYSQLAAIAPKEALAHLYANLGSTAAGAAAAHQGTAAGVVSLLVGGRPANVSLLPASTSAALTVDTLAASASAPRGLLVADPEAARALGELPGESFLALGSGTAGQTLAQYARLLGSIGVLGGSKPEAQTPGISVSGLLGGLLTPLRLLTETGAEAKRDFQSWMGPGGVFAGGSGLLDLKAALVIASTNPALSRAAVAKLSDKLRAAGASVQPTSLPSTDAAVTAKVPGLPVVLDIANGRDASGQTKFVIGLGDASVAAALNPPSRFSSSPLYGQAAAALGEGIQPSVVLQVPTLLTLLEGIGLNEDPSVAPAVPFLRAVTLASGGGKSLGSGSERFRLVLGLRQGG